MGKPKRLARSPTKTTAAAALIEKSEEVAAPGVPPSYPDPKRLITDDCIRP